MGLLDRFKKKPALPTAEGLAALQERGDLPGLARAYFALGEDCLNRGDRDRARMWLGRCQAVTEGSDQVYEAVGDKLIDRCSDLLLQLEGEGLFPDRMLEEIEESYDQLGGAEKRLWGLFTFCRLQTLLERAGQLPGCTQLRNTGEIIDLLLDHYYGEVDAAGWGKLKAYNDFLYGLSDSPAYTDLRQLVEVEGGAPLQLFDVNGEILLTELELYLDVVLHGEIVEGKAAELLQPQDLNDQMGLVRGAMLTDYYLRTRDGGTEDQPEVQAEAARIRADWAFLLQNPDEGAVRARAAEYRQLGLPG